MTGIQALERTMPDIPMQPGRCVQREFEYIRHGTQTLIASFADSFRSGNPIPDKLRRKCICQAGLRGWLKKE